MIENAIKETGTGHGNALLSHPKALLNQVRRLALQAGEATLAYFDESGFSGAEIKKDGSPVTVADREAEEIIRRGLKEILPEVPMVGEEATAAGYVPDLEGQEYFWLVDPLDGTREFLEGRPEYTVNIALIHNRKPILGVVYAPARGDIYASCGEGTAIRSTCGSDRDKAIKVRRPPEKGLTVVTSRFSGGGGRLEKFLEGHKVEKLLRYGSSLKICAVASGKADMYLRFGPTMEWDTAAGHAILRDAGGEITDFSGAPLEYGNVRKSFANPEFRAFSTEELFKV